MSPEKNPPPTPGYDESLYNLISSLWVCQGGNWEAMTRQDAFATATQPLETEKSNSGVIIRIEILASLILVGVSLLIHWTSNPQTVSVPVDTQKVQLQQRLPDNSP